MQVTPATGRRPSPPSYLVLAQYAQWRRELPGDEVWMQIGAFVERLQWPPRGLGGRAGHRTPGTTDRERPALRRMRPTRRGAIEGFRLPQLPRRVAARLAVGRNVVLVAQTCATTERIERRRPARRWIAVVAQAGRPSLPDGSGEGRESRLLAVRSQHVARHRAQRH